MFLKSVSFVSFADKNFKCLTEIKILSVRMSDTKFKILYTEQELVWQKITRSGMMYLSLRPNVWQVLKVFKKSVDRYHAFVDARKISGDSDVWL